MLTISFEDGSLGNYLRHVKLKTLGKLGDQCMLISDDTRNSQRLAILVEGDLDHYGIDDLLVFFSTAVASSILKCAIQSGRAARVR